MFRPLFARLLVDDHGCSVSCVVVQPVCIIGEHIDAAVAAIAGKRFIPAAVIVGEVGTNTVISTPPAVMKEVAAIVVFHGIINFGGWIPEGGPLRLARFELGRVLTQKDVP